MFLALSGFWWLKYFLTLLYIDLGRERFISEDNKQQNTDDQTPILQPKSHKTQQIRRPSKTNTRNQRRMGQNTRPNQRTNTRKQARMERLEPRMDKKHSILHEKPRSKTRLAANQKRRRIRKPTHILEGGRTVKTCRVCMDKHRSSNSIETHWSKQHGEKLEQRMHSSTSELDLYFKNLVEKWRKYNSMKNTEGENKE